MNYHALADVHLAIVLPALVLGTWLLLRRKGTHAHRVAGRVYMVLMLVTGIVTLFMPAAVGPRMLGHVGFIHAFSLLTLVCVPSAYFAALRGDIRSHRSNMIGLYVGGLLIAGAFAFAPGRMLHTFLLGH